MSCEFETYICGDKAAKDGICFRNKISCPIYKMILNKRGIHTFEDALFDATVDIDAAVLILPSREYSSRY